MVVVFSVTKDHLDHRDVLYDDDDDANRNFESRRSLPKGYQAHLLARGMSYHRLPKENISLM